MRKYIAIFCFINVVANAQDVFTVNDALPQPDIRFPEDSNPRWVNLQGSFLEPNRFAVVYDRKPERIRLEAGYGAEVLRVDKTTIGGEILVWSGLKTLSNFRFPVETVDYFFGLYSVSRLYNKEDVVLNLRMRVSHISSHIVDGSTDSIVGGSSSRFSREFISIEAMLGDRHSASLIASAGLKYVFHQVEKNEPVIQIPITIDYRILRLGSNANLHSFFSTAAGPSLPVYSAGVVLQKDTGGNSKLEIYGEYHSGHSRYGVDGNSKQSGFEIGVRIANLETD